MVLLERRHECLSSRTGPSTINCHVGYLVPRKWPPHPGLASNLTRHPVQSLSYLAIIVISCDHHRILGSSSYLAITTISCNHIHISRSPPYLAIIFISDNHHRILQSSSSTDVYKFVGHLSEVRRAVRPSYRPCRLGASVSSGFSKNALAARRIADGPSGGYLCKKPRPLRLPPGGPVLALSDKKSILTLVGRKTHGWVGSPPTQSCFHAFSPKKAYHCSWLTVFHAFPSKKVSHVGKNDRNVVSFTR